MPLPRAKYDPTYDYDHFEDLSPGNERRPSKPKPKRAPINQVRGIVVRARGHHFDVLLEDRDEDAAGYTDQIRVCEVRGRLLQEKGHDTLVAVGDNVWITQHGKHRGHIEQIEARHSVLSRQQPGIGVPAEDVILANPDQVLVVFAVAQPTPHLRMLDRFLVVAESNELPSVICANKVDLVAQGVPEELFGLYETIGYPVVYASAERGDGIDQLRDLLRDKVTVVAGPSGVGKSSLLNALFPDLGLRTGELRAFLDKGRHTTRAAQLFPLPMGKHTFVADTPGIRELGLYEIEPQNLAFYFREFMPFLHDCRYPNCTHDHEPACAIRSAVADGRISSARYESYLRLLHGDE